MDFKIVVFLLLTTMCHIINICYAYVEIFKPDIEETKRACTLPFAEIRQTSHVMFFVADNSPQIYLEYCLFNTRPKGQSVSLFSTNELYELPKSKELEYSNDYADLVIVIPELNDLDFYNRTIYYFTLSPKEIITYLIITTQKVEFACNKGVFRKDIFKYIEDYMNSLWHCYELINVIAEFPMMCPGYLVLYKGKKPSGVRLYDRTIVTFSAFASEEIKERLKSINLRLTAGYPLRANIFPRFPTSISTCSKMNNYLKMDEKLTLGLCGMDVYVMHDILHKFEFKVDFPDLDDSEGYGDADSKVATGVVGYLLNNTIDISFNSRFLVWYLIRDDINILGYAGTDSLCAVMKSPDEVPVWQYSYNSFRPGVWACLIVQLGLVGVTAKIFIKLRRKMFGRKYGTSYPVLGFIGLGLFGCNVSKRMTASILGGTCLLISIIILSLYQGNVNYGFTSLIRYKKYTTLAKLKEMQIQVYTSPNIVKTLGDVDTSQFVLKIFNKSDLLTHNNMATIQRKSDMKLEIIQSFLDKTGEPEVYIVKECYARYFLTYIARRDFPFYEEVNYYLMLLMEAGLPDAYYRMTQLSLNLESQAKTFKSITKPRPFFPSSIEEQRVAFCVLFAGYLVSTFTLIVERWMVKRRIKSTPDMQ